MTTGIDWVEEVRGHLLGGLAEGRNELAATVGIDDTQVTFKYGIEGIRQGTFFCIDLETFYVWETDANNKTAQVQRSANGSPRQVHLNGTHVYVRPRFETNRIFRVLNQELMALSSGANGLFAPRTYDTTYDPDHHGIGFDPDTGFNQILAIHRKSPNSFGNWERIRAPFDLVRSVPEDTSFPYPYLINIIGWPVSEADQLMVTYKSSFTPLSNVTDNVSLTGLPTTAYDIPPIGAAIRLLPAKEARRNQVEAQGDTRRPEEVPPGAASSAVRTLIAIRAERIKDESTNLLRDYPPVMPTTVGSAYTSTRGVRGRRWA